MRRSEATAQAVSAQLQQFDANAALPTQRASSILSTVQLEALKKFQAQQRSMTEMGLKMTQSMFKDDP